MPHAEPLIPEVTDEDIAWASSLLGLARFDEQRRTFLKRGTTLDVSACPGSGKTTLIVAKLAIMARKWPHRTKGICVLSHTNVAREQIEHRLGSTVVGQRLLTYPHFIDTIHGFANRFLALPWLSSKGYPSPTIDNDVTTAYRRAVLGKRQYNIVQGFLEKKFSDFSQLRICDRNYSFDLNGKPFPAAKSSRSYQLAKQAIVASAQAGHFCHEEMFIWASALLEDHHDAPLWLANRFPLIMLDEMQDTSEDQSSFLNKIFPRASDTPVVQRIGDPNQEIFDSANISADPLDPFPDTNENRYVEISNSYRFGPRLAAIASPFAVHPVRPDGLRGMGPYEDGRGAERRHAIFVFPDESTEGVLDAYGKYVLSVLGDSLPQDGLVTAIGHRHHEESGIGPGHAHYPKTVGHYWSGYTPEAARRDPHPETLAQYIWLAQASVQDGRVLAAGANKLASGTLKLAQQMSDIKEFKRTPRSHRSLREELLSNDEALRCYERLVKIFLIDRLTPSKASWPGLRDRFVAVASALCPDGGDSSRAGKFLRWPQDASTQLKGSTTSGTPKPNIYRVSGDNGIIDIRLGSIHSVKGQTHFSTLLLSTYWRGHSSKRIMPWLLGEKKNGKDAGKQDMQRLLHTYVAMTRPSHLLCIAIPQSALGTGDSVETNARTLRSKGWTFANFYDG